MKLLLDFFPLAVFVGVYFFSGADKPIYPAVMGLMIASVIQTIGSRIITGKFEKLHLWTLLVTLAFGALTLIFRNPEFVQWKASILVWAMAGVFVFRQIISKKLLIQEMLQSAIEDKLDIPEKLWRKVNMVWPVGYTLFGFLNLYVAYNFSEAFWVKFKLFGLMALTVLLLAYTMLKLMPYFPEEAKENTPDNKQADASTDD